MYDELEQVFHAISEKKFWREGWIAVRQTLNFDSERFTPEVVARLSSLEKRLRPTDLVHKVRAIVLSEELTGLDLDDFENDSTDDSGAAMERAEAIARGLGKAVAADDIAFGELLAELVSGSGWLLWSFGQGLSEGTRDPKALWLRLVKQLATSVEGNQNVQILRGMLNTLHENNKQLADALLDDAVQNETLAAWYPVLQGAVGIDGRGVDRLRRSLALGNTPVRRYQSLAWGRATDHLSGQELKDLLLTIGKKPDGFDVAVEILCMRLHSDDQEKRGYASEIIDAGRELLRQLTFAKKNDREDYRLATVSKSCLVGEGGAEIAREICRKLKDSVSKYETRAFGHEELLQALFGAQPAAALDELCAGDAAGLKRGIRVIDYFRSLSKNPLDAVSEAELLRWCNQEPKTRYPTAAAITTIFHGADEPGLRRWTNIALRLLERAPDRVEVLRQFIRRFSPMSWSGSRATIVASNAKLLDELVGYSDPALTDFIAQEKVRLSNEIAAERRAETLEDSAKDERFE
jgi:hypothetical protein